MIDIRISSRRVPTTTAPSPSPFKGSEQSKMLEQFKARDKIIRALAAKVPYVEGEIVTPYCEEARKKHGEKIVVEYICDTYVKYGTRASWPKDDKDPMIIGALNPETQVRFVCTPNFLKPLTNDGKIPKDD